MQRDAALLSGNLNEVTIVRVYRVRIGFSVAILRKRHYLLYA